MTCVRKTANTIVSKLSTTWVIGGFLVLVVAASQLAELASCYPGISWDLRQFDRYESVYGVSIGQFARLDISDTGVADPISCDGILSFPWANFAVHGLCARFFGPGNGFIIAELFVALAAFAIWTYALRVFLPRDARTLPFALLAAAVTTSSFSSATDWLVLLVEGLEARPLAKYVMAVSLLLIVGSSWIPSAKVRHYARILSCLSLVLCGLLFQPGEIYSDRFPRPFVSQLALIPGLALALKILARGNSTKAEMTLLAVLGGLTLHLDFYGLLALAILSAAAILRCVLNQGITATLKLLPWATLPVLIFLIPFIITRLYEASDLPIRLGIRSGESLYLVHFNLSVLFALVCAVGAGYALVKLTPKQLSEKEWPIELLWPLIPLAYLLSSVLLPVLTGKSIQMWHYLYLTSDAFSLIFLLLGILTLSRLGKQADAPKRPSPIWACCLTTLIVASAVTWLTRNEPGKRGVYNPSEQRLVSFQGGRNNLYSILETAKNLEDSHLLVLGSTDYTANCYWSAWQGPVLTPDSTSTVLATSELAYRTAVLYSAAEIIGIGDIDFTVAFTQWLRNRNLDYFSIFAYAPQNGRDKIFIETKEFCQSNPPRLRCDLLLLDSSTALGRNPPKEAVIARKGKYVLLKAQGLGWFREKTPTNSDVAHVSF